MALNLLAVLPPLNNIQLLLERHANKYGPKIYMDPTSHPGGGQQGAVIPSLKSNVTLLAKIADNIIQYQDIASNIKNVFASKNKQNKIYLSIGLVIVTIIVVLVLGFVYLKWYRLLLKDDFVDLIEEKERIKIEQGKNKDQDDEDDGIDLSVLLKQLDHYKCIMFLSFAIIFIFVIYCVYFFMIQSFRKSNFAFGAHSSLYTFTKFLETEQIAYIVDLINDPNVIAAYNYSNPSRQLSSSKIQLTNKQNDDDTCVDQEGVQQETIDPTATLASLSKITFLPGFDGSKHIDPYALKKQLQKFNIFEQIQRLKVAMASLQDLFLKSKDENYKSITLSKQLQKNINLQIVDLLTTKCAIVPNLNSGISNGNGNITPLTCTKINDIASLLDSIQNTSNISNSAAGGISMQSDSSCFAACLNDPTSSGAVFTGGMCYSLPSNLTFNSNATTNAELVFIKSNGNSFIKAANVESALLQPVGCINNLQKIPPVVLANENGIFTGAAFNNFSYNSNSSLFINNNLLINQNANFPQTFISLKQWFQGAIVDLIVASDPSKSYAFSSDDNAFITSKIQAFIGNSFTIAAGPLADILNDLPIMIKKTWQDNSTPQNKDIFIPLVRFQQKLGEMDIDTFISQFVFYCEEIHATSAGIYNLNSIFFDQVAYNDHIINKSIKHNSFFSLCFVVAIAIIIFNIKLWFQPPDVGVAFKIKQKQSELDTIINNTKVYTASQKYQIAQKKLIFSQQKPVEDNIFQDLNKHMQSKSFQKQVEQIDESFVTDFIANLPFVKKYVKHGKVKNIIKLMNQIFDFIIKIKNIFPISFEQNHCIWSFFNDLNTDDTQIWVDGIVSCIPQINDLFNEMVQILNPFHKELSNFFHKDDLLFIQNNIQFKDWILKYNINDEALHNLKNNSVLESFIALANDFVHNIPDKFITIFTFFMNWKSNIVNLDTFKQFIDALSVETINQLLNSEFTDSQQFIEHILGSTSGGNDDLYLALATTSVLHNKDLDLDLLNATAAAAATATVTSSDMDSNDDDLTVEDRDNPENKRKIQTLENDILRLKMFNAFLVCVSISVPIMFLAIISGVIDKSNVIYDYNKNILDTNCAILVQNAAANMTYIYNDIVSINSFNIKGAPTPLIGPEVVGHPNIYVDPWIEKINNAEPPPQFFFQNILQNVTLTKDKSITLDNPTNPNSLDSVYDNCINIIRSYNNCNALFSMASNSYPFPIIEITVYGVVLLITLFIIGIIMMKLQPVKAFKELRILNILIDKAERGAFIATEDLPQELLDWTHDEKIKEGKFNSYMIIFAGIFLVVFGIVFAILASKSGSSLQDVLYASNLFRDNKCYPPKL